MTEPSSPFGHDQADLVTVRLKRVAKHDHWLRGSALDVAPHLAGFTCINSLTDKPRALVPESARTLHFFMPS